MNDLQGFGQGLVAIVGAIIGVSILSVILSRRSSTTALVQTTGSTLSNVIAAAVSPANAATNGNNGQNAFSLPSLPLQPLFQEV